MHNILIIDDERDMRDLMRDMLERAGYGVFEAGDGLEGIEVFRRETVSLIITDIFMPEKEGLETIIELKRVKPDLKIIVISGAGTYKGFDYLPIARNLGAHRAFSKPFSPSEIVAAIQELLGDDQVAEGAIPE